MSSEGFIPRTVPSNQPATSPRISTVSQPQQQAEPEIDPLVSALPEWDLLPATQFLRRR
ncbi:hypothetical protein ACF3NX_15345 (plasmid) [Acetobacter orientalis]|uniref:hypothetical protein n=1 Tax=Acetobacter orientalis TaxID=146474 RepID=UPI00386FAF85